MSNWMHTASYFPLWLTLTIIMAACTGLSWLLVQIVRRHQTYPQLKENNEFVGFTYAVYGVIYGVVLAFTIVTAWEHYSDAEHIVMHEATILSELWRDAGAFQPEVTIEIHKDIRDYVSSVIEHEWAELSRHGRHSKTTVAAYEALWSNSYLIHPETKNQESFLAEYLSKINELSGTRRLRLMYSSAEINGILWLVMLVGAVPTIAYTLLFSAKHGWVQVMITGFMIGLVSLCLLVALCLQYPFTGRVSVSVEPFVELAQTLDERAATDAARMPPVTQQLQETR